MSKTKNTDFIQRFYFKGQPFRGAIVNLQNSFIESLNNHNYPISVNNLLGQGLAATLLMGIHLKQNTKISIQARGNDLLKLLISEACLFLDYDNTSTHTVRAVARLNEKSKHSDFDNKKSLSELMVNGQLAITIEPENKKHYQGIVSIDFDSLAECLMCYFNQSEQLRTFIHLTNTETRVAGFLIQQMPNEETFEENPDVWETLQILAKTISNEELIDLQSKELLHRLFHEFDLQLNSSDKVEFSCSCSQERTVETLKQIDPKEILSILDEDKEVIMDCDFCSSRYRFTKSQLINFGIPI